MSTQMIFQNYFNRLRAIPLEEDEDTKTARTKNKDEADSASPIITLQNDVATILQPHFAESDLVIKAMEFAKDHLDHIMDFTRLRALSSLFSMLNQAVRNVIQYNSSHPDFPMQQDALEKYMTKSLVYGLLWSFSGDGKLKARTDLGDYLRSVTTIPLPPTSQAIIDFEVCLFFRSPLTCICYDGITIELPSKVRLFHPFVYTTHRFQNYYYTNRMQFTSTVTAVLINQTISVSYRCLFKRANGLRGRPKFHRLRWRRTRSPLPMWLFPPWTRCVMRAYYIPGWRNTNHLYSVDRQAPARL